MHVEREVVDGLRGCCPRHAVDRRRADEPRVKRVDARGADNDLACAFVFLVKPTGLYHDGDDLAIVFVFFFVCAKPAAKLVLPSSSGPPSTIDKEPESTTAPAPRRGRGTSRVTRRRLGHGASVRLQRRAS